jgi:two-component system phosphate regulon sensor histidine kinase PhoR
MPVSLVYICSSIMKKLRGSAILMILAIAGITGFQAWWLVNNYKREKQSLDIKTAFAFRQTILQLQSQKLELETISFSIDSARNSDILENRKFPRRMFGKVSARPAEPAISLLNLIQEKLRDSSKMDQKMVSLMKERADTLKSEISRKTHTITISTDMDSLSRPPGMIRKVRVEKGRDPTDKETVVAGFKNRPMRVISRDSFSFHEKEDERFFIDKGMPPIGSPAMPGEEDGFERKNNTVFRFLYDVVDSLTLKDSVTLKEVDSAYAKRLEADNIAVGFNVNRLESVETSLPNAVTIGFSQPATFSYTLNNTFGYMFGKLKLPILFSLLLVGITIASFVLLYRNMMKQKKLAALKNEFISNITHELKTPIATVGVAIEALKNFNAIHDPKRTEEYLTISQNELQRLNLLVDKVLKLSMFENKEIDLKYEMLNLPDIVDEVVTSMRLQIEKYRAKVTVNTEGDCSLQGDKLHLLSVVFNLLDNALKYGSADQEISINMEEKENSIELRMKDNGIGIPVEYKDKIFEKFFRIPHGDTHNAKGYGLGLSYVAHVIKKHKGTIAVESEAGKGSTFVINLPKQNT